VVAHDRDDLVAREVPPVSQPGSWLCQTSVAAYRHAVGLGERDQRVGIGEVERGLRGVDRVELEDVLGDDQVELAPRVSL